MNWNGGTLSKSRNTAIPSLSAAQKFHFAKALTKYQAQSEVALQFSELDHAKKELAAQKRSPPSIRADRQADYLKTSPASLKEGRAATTLSSLSPTFPISSECKKDDSVEEQKRKLLAINDWCGLKNPLLSERVSTSIADVVVNSYEREGFKRFKKRRLSDSSETYSPSEGLTGILDSLKTPDARNLHNAEGKRYIANKRQQSESARRIVPLDKRSGLDGSKVDPCSPHRASPICSVLKRVVTPNASPYLNSDEDLFADEHTKSQPLFQPSPLRIIAYDWSDIKSDAALSTGSQSDTRSLTDSPVETEPKMANDYRHPSMPGLHQVPSTIRTRLTAELAADAVPMIASGNMPHVTNSGFLRGVSYAPARPVLHSENLTQFLHKEDIFETSLLAQSNLHEHIPNTAANEDTATEISGVVAGSLISKEETIGNPTITTLQSPKVTKNEELLSPDSGWRGFVIGSADGEISDISSTIRHCVKPQPNVQSPDPRTNKKAHSPSSSPHQFASLYSEPVDELPLDQQVPQDHHQHQEIYSILSSPHRFSSIFSDQPTDLQSTAHAANNPFRQVSTEIPFFPLEHPQTPRHQLVSPYDREPTEEQEQPAVKPTFIFTKPARFMGDRVTGTTSLTGMGESRRSTDSRLGQVQPEWRLEVEEEDIED